MPASVKLDASQPIGLFDSGIGGLTVARAIGEKLPKERLIYFGDTAHLPYGDKSPDSIKYYAIRIAQFLLDHKCKMIVIACNTASALAYDTVKDFVGKRALVVNVIDPVVKKITDHSKLKKIGVIGTKGTIKSGIHAKKLTEADKSLEVHGLATPLLVPMIEEGFFNNKISRAVIDSYLSRPKLKKIDALILGCTHYPLIKKEIEAIYQGKVPLIDSADEVAEYVYHLLKRNNILNTSSKKPVHKFYVSDYTNAFEKNTNFFFNEKIKLEEARIWK
ncbi:MAG TPA: glutamate racemase [Bacteroidia bacterium]|jgi:glutamate racemase|nr:glutamate racemase [Bacteroidia bacterium]